MDNPRRFRDGLMFLSKFHVDLLVGFRFVTIFLLSVCMYKCLSSIPHPPLWFWGFKFTPKIEISLFGSPESRTTHSCGKCAI